jgi:hypothetical protein
MLVSAGRMLYLYVRCIYYICVLAQCCCFNEEWICDWLDSANPPFSERGVRVSDTPEIDATSTEYLLRHSQARQPCQENERSQ